MKPTDLLEDDGMRHLRWRSRHDGSHELSSLRSEAIQQAQHATATAYIFEVRARRLDRNLNLLTFVGVAVPLVVGAVALAYGADFGPLKLLIPIAALIGAVQLIIFVWSVVARWVDRYNHAVRAIATNRSLAQRYESLVKQATVDPTELRHEIEILKAVDAFQEESDYRQGITDAEKRMGMHALLRHYQKECAGCREVPTDMTPTKCGVCGDYPNRWVKR